MNSTRTQFRSTVEAPNDIKKTVNSIFEQLDTCIERKMNCDREEKNERSKIINSQKHSIQKLVESICIESGMAQEDIDEYVSKVFRSGSDSVTIEVNYGSFGRIGVDITDGQTDVFSSIYDNYNFKLPKTSNDDSISELKDEIERKSVSNDDGVGFAINIRKSGKDKIRVRVHVFDRPNEILLQRDNSKSLISKILR